MLGLPDLAIFKLSQLGPGTIICMLRVPRTTCMHWTVRVPWTHSVFFACSQVSLHPSFAQLAISFKQRQGAKRTYRDCQQWHCAGGLIVASLLLEALYNFLLRTLYIFWKSTVDCYYSEHYVSICDQICCADVQAFIIIIKFGKNEVKYHFPKGFFVFTTICCFFMFEWNM